MVTACTASLSVSTEAKAIPPLRTPGDTVARIDAYVIDPGSGSDGLGVCVGFEVAADVSTRRLSGPFIV
jgi:hypothetical protein